MRKHQIALIRLHRIIASYCIPTGNVSIGWGQEVGGSCQLPRVEHSSSGTHSSGGKGLSIDRLNADMISYRRGVEIGIWLVCECVRWSEVEWSGVGWGHETG